MAKNPQPARSSKSSKSGPKSSSKSPARGKNAAPAKPAGNLLDRLPEIPPFPDFNVQLPKLSLDRKLDILGAFLALAGLLTILSLVSNSRGFLTGWWVDMLRRLAGEGALALPAALTVGGVWLVLRKIDRLPVISLERLVGVVLFYLNLLVLFHLVGGGGWPLAEAGKGGGYLGALGERALSGALGGAGAWVVWTAWLLIALVMTLDVSFEEITAWWSQFEARAMKEPTPAASNTAIAAPSTAQAASNTAIAASNTAGATRAAKAAPARGAPRAVVPTQAAQEDEADAPPWDDAISEPEEAAVSHELPAGFQPLGEAPATPARAGARRSARGAATPGATAAAEPADAPPAPAWPRPDVTQLLEAGLPDTLQGAVEKERGKLIEDTLASFGAPAHVVEIHRGPTITQFGVEPDFIESRSGKMRVRVSKIVSLADDLALALAASRIRIQAPVPGRNFVGIEVPNSEISRVMLRDVMESESYQKMRSPLRFALGKDVAGKPVSYDLAAMPHLLIAGTTGSGKSVCVNSILSCLLVNNTPNELRLILVDPKRVELTGYNGIPHLLAPVIVEAEKVTGALQWVQREMDARYHRFSQVGARNIKDYNGKETSPLPYLVVVIDELADLMMLAPDETERSLTRLAQLARATGIHLILATQRPSVDVLTGLIKANFPARIAFAVASGIDSRVILDQPGAERLLGRGDMLFQAPDAPAPARLQGVFVSDAEIQRVVEFWRTQSMTLDNPATNSTMTPVDVGAPSSTPLHQAPLWDDDTRSDDDPLLPNAIEVVRQERRASISLLQRKLRIGYTRSARLVDALEEKGIIGPAQPNSQVRPVLDPTANE